MERSPVAGKNNTANKLPGENLIERDTIVLADVAVRRGRDSVKVSKQYRVVDIHDKYYNKWFMAKNPQSFWEGLQVKTQGSHAGSKCSAGVQ